ncbi:hypothetical protein HY772_08015 [Candidatus Woesearchaeota archaeon]|nr:hypothetical protein [Candidatus Woesearchaeota archaeon]
MNESTKGSLKESLRWFFNVDFKDWTNYAAMIFAGLLLYWGIRTIIGTVTAAATVTP